MEEESQNTSENNSYYISENHTHTHKRFVLTLFRIGFIRTVLLWYHKFDFVSSCQFRTESQIVLVLISFYDQTRAWLTTNYCLPCNPLCGRNQSVFIDISGYTLVTNSGCLLTAARNGVRVTLSAVAFCIDSIVTSGTHSEINLAHKLLIPSHFCTTQDQDILSKASSFTIRQRSLWGMVLFYS